MGERKRGHRCEEFQAPCQMRCSVQFALRSELESTPHPRKQSLCCCRTRVRVSDVQRRRTSLVLRPRRRRVQHVRELRWDELLHKDRHYSL